MHLLWRGLAGTARAASQMLLVEVGCLLIVDLDIPLIMEDSVVMRDRGRSQNRQVLEHWSIIVCQLTVGQAMFDLVRIVCPFSQFGCVGVCVCVCVCV
jgi:hypothetical protein